VWRQQLPLLLLPPIPPLSDAPGAWLLGMSHAGESLKETLCLLLLLLLLLCG
jgi:hypothetical protein